MTSAPIAVANAVAYEINARGWAPHSPTVEMSHADWELDLKDSDGLRIDVVPASVPKFDQLTQGLFDNQVPIDIGVRKRFTGDEIDSDTGRTETSDINALVDLLYDIAKYFAPSQPSQNGRRLSQVPAAAWRSCEVLTIRDRQTLRINQQYTGVIRITYQLEESP